MKAYKGFDKDLKCRGFQYEIGKTYEEPEAKLCESGFHACTVPLDVLGYYYPSGGNRFCEVELDDVSDERRDDSKVCGRKLTVGAEIGIPGLAKAHIEYVKENIDKSAKQHVMDSAATNTGDRSAAEVGGKESVAVAIGCKSSARGKFGNWIVLSEWDDREEHIIDMQIAYIDGDKIKEDVWYSLKNGKFVEL